MKVIYEPWVACSNSYGDKGFWRKSISTYWDVCIWETENEEREWILEPLRIEKLKTPMTAKTAESLMFQIDLLLLEPDLAGFEYIVDKPFIFPENNDD